MDTNQAILNEVVKNGRIDEKKFFSKLNPQGNFVLDDSVMTTSAQSIKLYALDNQYKSINNLVSSYLSVSSKLPFLYKFLLSILLQNGLRISEALSFNTSHIINESSFFIKGLKGSHNRICFCNYCNLLDLKQKEPNAYLFSLFSRFFVHRLFISLGLYIQLSVNENRIVTHLFRYLYLYNLKKNNIDTETIKQNIGHKNIKSTKHYLTAPGDKK